MADFHRLGEAVLLVAGSEPGAFSELYGHVIRAGTERALENFAIARALTSFMDTIAPGEWAGTVGKLYQELKNHADLDRSNWPKTARALREQLDRLAPALRTQRLDVNFGGRTNAGRTITIKSDMTTTAPGPVAAAVP